MNIAQTLVAVDSGTWQPITVPVATISGRPFNVKRVIISNSVSGALDVKRRIASGTASTELTIPAGTQEVWPMSSSTVGNPAYTDGVLGEVIGYLQSVSGSFNVIIMFMG